MSIYKKTWTGLGCGSGLVKKHRLAGPHSDISDTDSDDSGWGSRVSREDSDTESDTESDKNLDERQELLWSGYQKPMVRIPKKWFYPLEKYQLIAIWDHDLATKHMETRKLIAKKWYPADVDPWWDEENFCRINEIVRIWTIGELWASKTPNSKKFIPTECIRLICGFIYPSQHAGPALILYEPIRRKPPKPGKQEVQQLVRVLKARSRVIDLTGDSEPEPKPTPKPVAKLPIAIIARNKRVAEMAELDAVDLDPALFGDYSWMDTA